MKLRVPGQYTGYYGVVPFEDGVSTRLVSPKEANLLRAIMAGVEVMQDDGVTVDEALSALSVILPLGHYLEFGTEPPSPFLTDWNGEYPKVAEPEVSAEAPAAPDQVLQTSAGYSREGLEKIADEKGIAGLREIGEPLGVKARGLVELIDVILAAQAEKAKEAASQA